MDTRNLTRRDFLQKGGALALGTAGVALLAACGGGSAATSSASPASTSASPVSASPSSASPKSSTGSQAASTSASAPAGSGVPANADTTAALVYDQKIAINRVAPIDPQAYPAAAEAL
ncbi:MAG: hypothetical protein ACYDAG_16050, partial [Chloroflexota bacterium]